VRSHAKAASASSMHREKSKLSLGVLATMLVCAAAFLGVGAPGASAAAEAGPGWSYKSSFGAGNFSATFETPRTPIAVDSNGDVFAVDQNTSLKVFSPAGTLLTEVGGNFRNIAIDTSDDTLYAEELPLIGNTVVRRYTSDGQPTPTYSVDPSFEIPLGEGLAVDPTSGDLLVADPAAEAVQRYDTAGVLQDTIATPSINPAWIVTVPDGSFYVVPAEGPDVTHFSGSGTLLGTVSGVGNLHGLAYDSARSAVVALVGNQLKTYATTGARSESPSNDAAGLGLTFDAGAGLLYEHDLTVVNSYEPSTVPAVSSPVVSDVDGHSAHLSAEADPGAGPPAGSEIHFEFSANGGVNWISTPSESISAAGIYEADLSGLLANYDYLVRAVASNELATTRTEAVPFSTAEIAPEVEATTATDVTDTSATLNGKINSGGLQTTWHFEYGTTTAYGSRVPASEASAGAERTDRAFSREIAGLQPGTTYHFRLVAENAAGFSAGTDRTFTTAAAGDLVTRAYEQVTPVDKEGAQVNSDGHVQTAEDGSAIAVSTISSTPDGPTTNMRQNYVAWREASNWSDWRPVDAPRDVADGIFESTVAALSADFEHALVASNRVLAPGGIAGGGNLYVKDLRTGTYTFVGGSAEPNAFLELTSPQINTSVFISAAPDFSWIIFVSQPSLLQDVSRQAVYRWTRSGGLSAVSVMQDGSTAPTQIRQAVGRQTQTSVDGSVVYFAVEFGAIYRRVNGQTTLVSHADGTNIPADIPLPATLDAVSGDGRYAVFHTTNSNIPPLTAHPVDPNGGAVYRYDSVDDTITYISDVRDRAGQTVYATDDAQTIYVDQSTISTVFGPLVVWHNGEERTIDSDGGSDAIAISPSGRYFGWVAADGSANLYDYETDESVCVSCPADGSPNGRAKIPGGGNFLGNSPSKTVTDDGTMFFDAPDRLLAADHNGSRDVYAYRAGRLSLISPGTADFDAQLVDSSLDGSSVFFQTTQGLVGQDTDSEMDVYVARVGGGFAAQNPPKPPAQCVRFQCGGSLGVPPEPKIGSDLGDGTGDQRHGAPPIGRVETLSASARKKLAEGKKVVLKVKINQPGTVTLGGRGVGSSSIKVKAPGRVGLPLVLKRPALARLHKEGSMRVRLTIRFDGKPLKSVSLVLRAPASTRGGRS
jgi:hypothetical protein